MIPNPDENEDFAYHPSAFELDPDLWSDEKIFKPNGDLISRSALKEDFKSRLAACNDWIEKAKDKETKIRARAVKTFIAEVIMTIDNAPTVVNEILTPKRPQVNCDISLSDIRWTDKLSLDNDGNVRDFSGNIVGHFGADMRGDSKNG